MLPSGQSWRMTRVLNLLRSDTWELETERLTESLTPEWREHLLTTIRKLTELADAHGLPTLQTCSDPAQERQFASAPVPETQEA